MSSATPESIQRTLDLVPGHFCHANFDGEFTWVHGDWEELLGVPADQLVGRRFLDFIHPDDLEATVEAMSVLSRGEVVSDFTNRYLRVDGAVRWLRWQARADASLIYALATDVTESMQRDLELLRANRILKLTGEIARVGYWRLDLQTQSVFWSEQTYRIHGVDPAEPVPSLEEAVAFYHPDDRPMVHEHVEAALKTGEPFAFEMRLIARGGELRHVRSKGVVERDHRGQTVAIIGIFQDLTEERKLQREVRDAERLSSLETMASSIAHEINNPLQYLNANLTVVRELVGEIRSASPVELVEELDQILSDCSHGAQQVGRIVKDLRQMVRGNRSGRVVESVDLAHLVQSALNITRCQVHLGDRLTVRLAPIPRIRAVPSELIQVLLNLLTNALQAIDSSNYPDAGAIRVRTFLDQNQFVIVEVEDNGPGVPEDLQRKVFEPFFTTKPLGIGHGLGLHICRGIVAEHDGDMTLDSRPGRTIFRIRLPLPEDSDSARRAPRGLPRILVVDDDPRVARSTARMLRKLGECQVETDAMTALEVALADPFDLVVSDVMMPSLTGWELAARLLAEHECYRERVMLMSGAAPAAYRPREAPDLPFLRKPFGTQALRDMVERMLAGDTGAVVLD